MAVPPLLCELVFDSHGLRQHIEQFVKSGLDDLNALALMESDMQVRTLSFFDDPKLTTAEIVKIINLTKEKGCGNLVEEEARRGIEHYVRELEDKIVKFEEIQKSKSEDMKGKPNSYSGWIKKQSNLSYKRRYFVIDADELKFYEGMKCNKLLGKIQLSRVRKLGHDLGKEYGWNMTTDKGINHFSCDSDVDRTKWIIELRDAISAVQKKTCWAIDIIYKKGYLTKQGRKRKNWKRRYFALTPGMLIYFPGEAECFHLQNRFYFTPEGFGKAFDKYAFGSIETMAARVEKIGGYEGQGNCFQILTRDRSRSLFLSAETPDEQTEWIEAIRRQAKTATMISETFQRQESNDREEKLIVTRREARTPQSYRPPPSSVTSADENEAKELIVEINLLASHLGEEPGIPNTDTITLSIVAFLEERLDELEKLQRTRVEELEEVVAQCNVLHNQYGLSIMDLANTFVQNIFKERYDALGYTEIAIGKVEDRLKQLQLQDWRKKGLFLMQQCNTLHEELGIIRDDYIDDVLITTVFDEDIDGLAEEDVDEIDEHYHQLLEEQTKRDIQALVQEYNELHDALGRSVDAAEDPVVIAILNEDWDQIGYDEKSLRRVRKRVNVIRNDQKLEHLIVECNTLHDSLGLTVDDYKDNELVKHIMRDETIKILSQLNDVTKHYESLEVIDPEERFRVLKKTCLALIQTLGFKDADVPPDVSQLLDQDLPPHQTSLAPIGKYISKLKRRQRKIQMFELLKVCEELHKELGYTADMFDEDEFISAIFSIDVQRVKYDYRTIKKIQDYIEDLKEQYSLRWHESWTGKSQRSEIKTQMKALVSQCSELHRSLRLTPHDFPDDTIAQTIFRGKTKNIKPTPENIDKVGLHLAALNGMNRRDSLQRMNSAPHQLHASLPTPSSSSVPSTPIPSPLPSPRTRSGGRAAPPVSRAKTGPNTVIHARRRSLPSQEQPIRHQHPPPAPSASSRTTFGLPRPPAAKITSLPTRSTGVGFSRSGVHKPVSSRRRKPPVASRTLPKNFSLKLDFGDQSSPVPSPKSRQNDNSSPPASPRNMMTPPQHGKFVFQGSIIQHDADDQGANRSPPASPRSAISDVRRKQQELARAAMISASTRAIDQLKTDVHEIQSKLDLEQKKDNAWSEMLGWIDEAEEMQPPLLTEEESSDLTKLIANRDSRIETIYEAISDSSNKILRFIKHSKRLLK